MGIMVYSLLMGHAGFCPSTVSLEPSNTCTLSSMACTSNISHYPYWVPTPYTLNASRTVLDRVQPMGTPLSNFLWRAVEPSSIGMEIAALHCGLLRLRLPL